MHDTYPFGRVLLLVALTRNCRGALQPDHRHRPDPGAGTAARAAAAAVKILPDVHAPPERTWTATFLHVAVTYRLTGRRLA
jgi:hypothetical protein